MLWYNIGISKGKTKTESEIRKSATLLMISIVFVTLPMVGCKNNLEKTHQ